MNLWLDFGVAKQVRMVLFQNGLMEAGRELNIQFEKGPLCLSAQHCTRMVLALEKIDLETVAKTTDGRILVCLEE